jgi:hypothetical protein
VINIRFIIITIVTVTVTLLFARYVSQILFDGKNSMKVYNILKLQEVHLKSNITLLQFDNARLQKEYFELKNLEPEE